MNFQRIIFPISLFVFVFIASPSFAQYSITDTESRVSSIADLHFLNDEEYVIVVKSEWDGKDRIEYYKNEVLQRRVELESHFFEYDLVKQDDSLRLVMTGENGCDIFINDYFIVNLDTLQGDNLITTIAFEPLEKQLKKVNLLQNGDIAYIEGYAGERSSSSINIGNGEEEIFSLALPESEIQEIEEYNDRIFFYGKDQCIIYNTSSQTVDTILRRESSHFLAVVQEVETDNYLILHSEGVIRTNVKDLYEEIYLPVGPYWFYDIVSTDKVYLLGGSEEQGNILFEISGDEVEEVEVNPFCFRVNLDEMYVSPGGKIVYTGNVLDNDYLEIYRPLSYVLVKGDLLTHNGQDYEVELLDAYGNGEDAVTVEVRLKNNSTDTLRGMQLFSSTIDGIWCTYSALNKKVEMLLPEEELIITESIPLKVNFKFDGELCVYGINVGQSIDRNLCNNYSCLQITNTEDVFQEELVYVSPVPSQDRIFLSTDERHFAYQIIDVQGRLVSTGNYVGEIDIHMLSNGMYFLKSEHGVHKFVKE